MALRRKNSKTPRDKRLAEIRKHLKDGTLPSYRKLAEQWNVTISTVHADVSTVKAEPPLHEAHSNLFNEDDTPRAGAEEGNLRGVSHGANSDRLIGPRAEEIAGMVFESNAHIDRARDYAAVMRYASTLARIERVYDWLDEQPDSVFANGGSVSHPVYGRLERWEVTADRAERALGITPAARVALGMPVEADALASKQKADLSVLTDYELRLYEYLLRKVTGVPGDPPLEIGHWSLQWLDREDKKLYFELMGRIDARRKANWRKDDPRRDADPGRAGAKKPPQLPAAPEPILSARADD